MTDRLHAAAAAAFEDETTPNVVGGWQLYELSKAEYQLTHPMATPEQYTAAMRRIARECGV